MFGVLFTALGAAFGPMTWYSRNKGLYHPDVDGRRLTRGQRWAAGITASSFIPLTFAHASPTLAMLFYVALIVGYVAVQSQFRMQSR